MIENPKTYSEPNAIHISLSDEAYAHLDLMCKESEYSRSKIIDTLILQTKEAKSSDKRDM